jgi:hypothetical protein
LKQFDCSALSDQANSAMALRFCFGVAEETQRGRADENATSISKPLTVARYYCARRYRNEVVLLPSSAIAASRSNAVVPSRSNPANVTAHLKCTARNAVSDCSLNLVVCD